ncbi:MAG: hypothetical protein ACXWIX_12635, partial [Croceibacterium sp.]
MFEAIAIAFILSRLDFHSPFGKRPAVSPMTALQLPSTLHARRLLAVVFGGVALAVGVALIAQVSGDRGIAPVAATTDISVRGIE